MNAVCLHHVLTFLVTLLTALNCWATNTCCQPPGKAIARCLQGLHCQERHDSYRHWMEQYFIHREEIKQDQLQQWLPVHRGQCILPRRWHKEVICTQSIFLCSRWKMPFPSHQEQIKQWGWPGAEWCTRFKRKKEVRIKSWVGKDNARQVHMPSTGC